MPRHTPIHIKRAEILRLISNLNQGGRGGAVRPIPGFEKGDMAGRRGGAADVGITSPFAASREAGAHPSGMDVQAPPGRELMVMLESLESRLSRIEEKLEEPARGGGGSEEFTLGGEIRMSLTADMLQFISSNSLTGDLELKGDGIVCHLYFEEGQVVHAEAPEQEGEAAFFAALALERGRYRFDETQAIPEKRTITANTQFLILEGLRQMDEAQGGE